MRWIVDFIFALALLATLPIWLTRLAATGKWRTDWAGRFGSARLRDAGVRPPTLLIHAVSVGEVDAVRELVDRIAEQTAGGWRIVVATTTNTGFARATRLYGDRFDVVRYPLDFSFAVRRFLDAVQPDLVALVELEVWPNFVATCRRRGISVGVINGRLSERSFRRYWSARPIIRPIFRKLDFVGAQTQAIAERFIALGVREAVVSVTDTMKWDTARIRDDAPGAAELAALLGLDRDRPIVVAGSTGPGEERMLIDVCPAEAQLVLAPRKPERFEEVARLTPMVRRSRCGEASVPASPPARGGGRLFLLDSIGELQAAYALADVAVVGRSFLGLYGSNLMEPIALGAPTIIGPHHSDFANIVAALRDGEGVVITDDPGQAIAQLLADRDQARRLAANGRAVIRARQGATQRYVDLLLSHMPGRATPTSQPAPADDAASQADGSERAARAARVDATRVGQQPSRAAG